VLVQASAEEINSSSNNIDLAASTPHNIAIKVCEIVDKPYFLQLILELTITIIFIAV